MKRFLLGFQFILAGILIYWWNSQLDPVEYKEKENQPLLKLYEVSYRQFNPEGQQDLILSAQEALYYEEKLAQLKKVLLNTPNHQIEAQFAEYLADKITLKEQVKVQHENSELTTDFLEYAIASETATIPNGVKIHNPRGYSQSERAVIQKNHLILSGKVESYYDGSH